MGLETRKKVIKWVLTTTFILDKLMANSKMWFDIHCTYYTIKQNLPALRNTIIEKDVDWLIVLEHRLQLVNLVLVIASSVFRLVFLWSDSSTACGCSTTSRDGGHVLSPWHRCYSSRCLQLWVPQKTVVNS